MVHRDVLQDIRAYNHTRHSSTRMQPAVVTRENARIAHENIVSRWKNETLKKRARKAPSRKDTRLSGAKRHFKFVLDWRNPHMYVNCKI